jgi:hypothetical protein
MLIHLAQLLQPCSASPESHQKWAYNCGTLTSTKIIKDFGHTGRYYLAIIVTQKPIQCIEHKKFQDSLLLLGILAALTGIACRRGGLQQNDLTCWPAEAEHERDAQVP